MFAVLHVPDFALQALLRTAPELAHRPLALLDGDRKRALVLAVTPTARAAGAEPGLTAPSALARCADLLLRQRHPGAETDARASLLAAASLLSPLVEDTAPGIATADVTALPAVQRRPRLNTALTQLSTLGLTATAGLAATPLLALYAARQVGAAPSQISNLKFQIIENPQVFLSPLPLTVAEPTPAQLDILSLWGLRTLGDFIALPKADIVQRLGPGGLALWERASGQATRPIQPLSPPQTFTAALDLEFPIETLEPLLFLLRRFVDRLALELRTAGLSAAELDLTLRLDDETEHQRTIRLPEPTSDADLLHRTLAAHLSTVQTASAVIGARLVLQPVRPLHRQPGLFDSGLRDPHGFAETLARTAALLGSDHVGTPRLRDTHRPDSATLIASPALVESAPASTTLPPLGLPLRRYRPPRPARVELSPSTRAPTYLWTETLQSPIAAHRGPWRLNGDWWQPDLTWAREEWDIALASPTLGLYRLAETPSGWFLDGEYD